MKEHASYPWTPNYTLTPAIARGLMAIEAARAVVAHVSLPPGVEAALRQKARVASVHYSTRIEGNRLTLVEAEQVIAGRKVPFGGRERDQREVRNYWNALLRVEEWAEKKIPLSEELTRRLHALVEKGARARPTPYREEQNAIRDSTSGALVYLPPEARDVPGLMTAMVRWIGQSEKDGLPVPLIAGLAHYQFVTIHPFYDGNGRTARLLATFLLRRSGYGLNGIFSLEEYHARDMPGYYRALVTHPHHNYYEGRDRADLTPWLEYFVATLSAAFGDAQREALRLIEEGMPREPEEMRRLDPRARMVLSLFAGTERITSADVAQALGLSDRMARNLLKAWAEEGWLAIANLSNRARAYELSAIYRQFIGNRWAMPDRSKNTR